MPLQSILLIGASGFLGPPICREFLHQKEKFARVAILADPSKVSKFSQLKDEGMEIVVGALTDSKSFTGFDTVISLLGNHAMKTQPQIIDAAIASGVTEFYPSEFGSDIGQGAYLTNRYFRDKHLTRAHAAAVAKTHPSFNYTLMMVGGFMETIPTPIFGIDTVAHTFTFYGAPSKREPLISVADTARYLVASTLLPKSPTQRREFRVPGTVLPWSEIIATVAAVQGVEYKQIYKPTEEAERLAKEAAAEGRVDDELTYSLKVIMGSEGQFGVPGPYDNDLFEIKPEGLESALKRYFGKN